MADFKGYLLELNGRVLPTKFIQTYKATPNQKQDDKSYQDITGQLHRNVLPHTRSKIDLTTPYLWLKDKIEFQSFFPDREAVQVTYWDDENNEYKSGKFYVPDIEYQVYRIDGDDMEYFPIRVALIEY